MATSKKAPLFVIELPVTAEMLGLTVDESGITGQVLIEVAQTQGLDSSDLNEADYKRAHSVIAGDPRSLEAMKKLVGKQIKEVVEDCAFEWVEYDDKLTPAIKKLVKDRLIEELNLAARGAEVKALEETEQKAAKKAQQQATVNKAVSRYRPDVIKQLQELGYEVKAPKRSKR